MTAEVGRGGAAAAEGRCDESALMRRLGTAKRVAVVEAASGKGKRTTNAAAMPYGQSRSVAARG